MSRPRTPPLEIRSQRLPIFATSLMEDSLHEPSQSAEGVTSTFKPRAYNGARENYAAEFRNIQLPTFWRYRPKLWFLQLESEFNTYRVRSDDVKYSSVIRHLNEATIVTIVDILTNLPDSGKYARLKEALIARYAESQEKQMQTLLSDNELGKINSQLCEMKARENAIDDLLRTLWLQWMRAQEMSPMFDRANLDSELAECKLVDHPISMTKCAAITPSPQQDFVQLTKQLADLFTKMEVLAEEERRCIPSQSRPKQPYTAPHEIIRKENDRVHAVYINNRDVSTMTEKLKPAYLPSEDSVQETSTEKSTENTIAATQSTKPRKVRFVITAHSHSSGGSVYGDTSRHSTNQNVLTAGAPSHSPKMILNCSRRITKRVVYF